MIVVRSLYCLKISGASFRAHLAKTSQKMGFKPTFSNRDVWMCKNFLPLSQELNDYAGSGTGTDTTALRPAPNTSNSAPTPGTLYYECICTLVDDLLTVLHNATAIMREIGSVYKLKAIDIFKEPWETPKQYPGADYGYYKLSNGTKVWYMRSDSYVKAAIKTVESKLAEEYKQLMRIAKFPLTSRYQP